MQKEAEYHSIVDSKNNDNDEIRIEPTDNLNTFKSYPNETCLQLKWVLHKYLKYLYTGGKHTVGCLEEAFEAGSVAYGCYLVAVFDPQYNTKAAYIFMLASAYASFIAHAGALLGAIKKEGPSYHKILKESIGGSVAGAAFLQLHCFQPNFKSVVIGSSLAAFFATIKAATDIYKENYPDFFRKPIGIFANFSVNAFFSMLVSTGVTGYTFDILEGLGEEISKSVYWSTVGVTLALNLLSESMLVYLEYNKYPNRLEHFLGVAAHLLQALLYGTEMTAFSIIFWFDAVTDLKDSYYIYENEWIPIFTVCILFGCTVMFNKLHHDKNFRELAAFYIPNCVKNLFNKHQEQIPHSEESSHSNSQELSNSDLEEYTNEPQQSGIFASCKQTLVNAWQNFPTIEEVGLAPPINEEPLLPEDKVETKSWWPNLSCCFWSNKQRVGDTEVRTNDYLPPPINLENPAGF